MNPVEAREIFIRQGLVGGEVSEDFARRWPFWQHNKKLMAEIESLEHKSRRPDVLVDDELIYAFYDHVIPEGIHNGADFDHWRKEAERADPKILFLSRDDLMRHEAAGITTDLFPKTLPIAGIDRARAQIDYARSQNSRNRGVEFYEGDLTTLSLGFSRGWDEVRKRGDLAFQERTDRRSYRAGISQIITKSLIMSAGLEVITDEGFLNNPYRSVRYVDLASGQKTGAFLDQRENYRAAARWARGRALDCFTCTGGDRKSVV